MTGQSRVPSTTLTAMVDSTQGRSKWLPSAQVMGNSLERDSTHRMEMHRFKLSASIKTGFDEGLNVGVGEVSATTI